MVRIAALASLAALTACQTAGVQDTLGSAKKDEGLTSEDLRGYCPNVTLREGTAILQTYVKKHDDDPDYLVYQATITDVTRICNYENGQLHMTVAAAGRVVNGPKGTRGNLELPIRVALKQGESLPYSQLGKITVDVAPGAGATQFIYKDENVYIPAPTVPNVAVYVGFDEGPYNTP